MIGLIPAAGAGRRLRPHTHSLPKALLQVAGKPILGHIMDGIMGLELDEVILVVGTMGEKIQEWVKGRYKIPISFVHQRVLKGLGHSVWLARNMVKGRPLLIVYGDTIFEGDLREGINPRVDGSLGVKRVEDSSFFGVVELEGGVIRRLVEKPGISSPGLAIVGVNFIHNSDLLFSCLNELMEKGITTGGEYQLTDAFQLMVERGGRLTVFPVENWWDCGRPESLLATNRHLLEGLSEPGERRGCIITPPVYLAATAKVENSILGPYLSVGDGAKIEGSIISDSIIGARAEVTNCLLRSSLVGDNAVVRGNFTRLNVGDSSTIDFKSLK